MDSAANALADERLLWPLEKEKKTLHSFFVARPCSARGGEEKRDEGWDGRTSGFFLFFLSPPSPWPPRGGTVRCYALPCLSLVQTNKKPP